MPRVMPLQTAQRPLCSHPARPAPLSQRGHPVQVSAAPSAPPGAHVPEPPSTACPRGSGLQQVLLLVPRLIRVRGGALLGARRGPAGLAEDEEEDEDEQRDDAVERNRNDCSGGESRPHRRCPVGRNGTPGSAPRLGRRRSLRPGALAGGRGDGCGAGSGTARGSGRQQDPRHGWASGSRDLGFSGGGSELSQGFLSSGSAAGPCLLPQGPGREKVAVTVTASTRGRGA